MPYTFWEMPMEELPGHYHAIIEDILYPVRRYLGYRSGPTVLFKDGKEVPLLYLLAMLAKPDLDLSKDDPVWADTDWHNARKSNVKILERNREKKRAGRRPTLDLGVPYGHPDYQKLYYAKNREKMIEYRKQRYRSSKMFAVIGRERMIEEGVIVTGPVDETMDLRLQGIIEYADSIKGSGPVPIPVKEESVKFKLEKEVTWKEVNEALPESEQDKYIAELEKLPDPYVKE